MTQPTIIDPNTECTAAFAADGMLHLVQPSAFDLDEDCIDLPEPAQRKLFDMLKEKFEPVPGPFIIMGFSNRRGVIFWQSDDKWDTDWQTAEPFDTKAAAKEESKQHKHGVVTIEPLSDFFLPAGAV